MACLPYLHKGSRVGDELKKKRNFGRCISYIQSDPCRTIPKQYILSAHFGSTSISFSGKHALKNGDVVGPRVGRNPILTRFNMTWPTHHPPITQPIFGIAHSVPISLPTFFGDGGATRTFYYGAKKRLKGEISRFGGGRTGLYDKEPLELPGSDTAFSANATPAKVIFNSFHPWMSFIFCPVSCPIITSYLT